MIIYKSKGLSKSAETAKIAISIGQEEFFVNRLIVANKYSDF